MDKLILEVAYRVLMAILNRARGSDLYTLVSSTEVTRLVSTFLMALSTTVVANHQDAPHVYVGLMFTWGLLLLWCQFGWMKYEASAVGGQTDMTATCFKPVDWIMSKLWTPTFQTTGLNLSYRLWGCLAMGLRHCLMIPALAVFQLAANTPDRLPLLALTPLLGACYFLPGFLKGSLDKYSVFVSDLFVGLGISLLLC